MEVFENIHQHRSIRKYKTLTIRNFGRNPNMKLFHNIKMLNELDRWTPFNAIFIPINCDLVVSL